MLLLFESITTVKVNSKKYFYQVQFQQGIFRVENSFLVFVRRFALQDLPTPGLSGKTHAIIAGCFPLTFSAGL
jgi:hypothetical protein